MIENFFKNRRLHYWKRDLCRVQTALLSVKNRALGKELYSAKISLPSAGHSAKDFFVECQTLGKISTLSISCPRNGVRSRPSLPSACC